MKTKVVRRNVRHDIGNDMRAFVARRLAGEVARLQRGGDLWAVYGKGYEKGLRASLAELERVLYMSPL